MPTKAELERKIADLRRQLQTATEKEHESQETIIELRQLVTQQETTLEETLRERDDAVGQLEARLSEMSSEIEYRVQQEVENVRQTMVAAHQREVETQADLIGMLKDKLSMYEGNLSLASVGRNDDPRPSRDLPHVSNYSVATDVDSEASLVVPTHYKPTPAPRTQCHAKPTPAPRKPKARPTAQLPPLPMFGSTDTDDGDAFNRWINKLHRHAQLQQWTEHETLLQFELHLTGRAELLYEVLPSDDKRNLDTATAALRNRLQPVQHAALMSAQLMRRKQGAQESIDKYAQCFEQLFERSYGTRTGMDTESKALLKRDLFTQGLLRKWQEKIQPSAATFHDVLFQARAAEEQEHTLSELHGTPSPKSTMYTPPPQPKRTYRQNDRENYLSSSRSWPRPQGACFSCGKMGHLQKDCPLSKPPPDSTGQSPKPANAISTSMPADIQQPQHSRRNQLWKELTTLEFEHLSELYGGTNNISAVTSSVGPLYYANVDIEGSLVEALVDPGSAATLMSFNLFKKIGKKANMPPSVLSKPSVTLRDYNQHTIPIGASVDLNISFNGHTVVAPVHICSPDSHVESCLLGTNVVIPLRLMVPTIGVQPKPNDSCVAQNTHIMATVHLVHAARLPSRAGTIVEVRTSQAIPADTQLLFEPGDDILQSKGLALNSCLVECSEHGYIHLMIENPSPECQELPCDVIVGRISECHHADYVDFRDTGTETQNSQIMVQTVSASHTMEAATQRKQKLVNLIQMSGDELTTQDAHLICDKILEYHDIFSLEEWEYGKVDIVKHYVNTEAHPPINQPLRRIPYAH